MDRRLGQRSRRARSAEDGSLFLNVGSKPTDPWTALDVAQAARPHLELQNTIHWIKSIAIEKALAGARAGLEEDLAVGHYKPINSERFLHDCHEFVFHFTPDGDTPLAPPGDRRAIPGQVERRALAHGRRRPALPRQHLVHPVRHDPEPRQGSPASGDVPAAASRRCACGCTASIASRRVADPFLGLGSTAVACAQLGLNFVGIEMDEGYLKEAIARVTARRVRLP